jgi:hypothetical protein
VQNFLYLGFNHRFGCQRCHDSQVVDQLTSIIPIVIKSKDLGLLLFDITMTIDLPELLCRVNFPLYQACMVSPRHLLLAGGGGAAKTGVFNGFVSRPIFY